MISKKNKNYSVKVKTNLITNFKPNFLIKNNNFENFSDKIKKNKIFYKNQEKSRKFCKNFIIFLLLLKFKNSLFFEKSNIFIKKKKKNVYTILRSPYRHKLARHQISFNRYEINSTISIKLKKPFYIKNWENFLKLFNFLIKFNNFFESNIIYVNSINLNYPITYEKIFLF